MKQGKAFGIILGIVNIILIVVCIFCFLRKDRTEPVFSFQKNDLIYMQGMDTARLMEGITAFDSNDGDITENIVIEKLIENEEASTLIVFYAVSDRAGNVSKASREFAAKYLRKDLDEDVRDIKEAGIEAEFDVKVEENISSGSEQMPTPVQTESPTEAPIQEPTTTSTATPTASPTAAPTAIPDTDPQDEIPTPEGPAEAFAQPPEFTLKVSEIKTQVGIRPALVDVIGSLSDDKDSYETLFHNIVVSKYDINKAGTYHVTLTTTDSDGNTSPARPLTIIVE